MGVARISSPAANASASAIAQALLRGPRLLLLDEPLSAMDSERKAEIARAIERVRDKLAIPIVYVSHALDEVARLADHLVLLAGGRAIASGALGATLARLDLPTAVAEDAGVVIDGRVAEHDEPNQLTRVAFEGDLCGCHTSRGRSARRSARERSLGTSAWHSTRRALRAS